ncbi:hypothetical protein DB347_06585 [Opitutaceae bacterium EW11]|nr:hypothetical protein DB347_06585 [Opitutaceae bacterium EW11]
MKRFYFIFPVVLLAVFSVFYSRFSKASDEADRVREAKIAQAKQEEAEKRKSAEAKSREDSAKRTAERLAEEKRKDDERLAKWDADSKRILDETQQYVSTAERFNQEIADLEKQLAQLRTAKDARTREFLETASEAELAAITKRSAEMEIQRLTEMIARKVAGTSLVNK